MQPQPVLGDMKKIESQCFLKLMFSLMFQVDLVFCPNKTNAVNVMKETKEIDVTQEVHTCANTDVSTKYNIVFCF